ncbi:MAG: RNA polymerase sporulation sigma factor SigE [Firmicutes bacterium]|nr:RNA polymerase sporulation sigma factor SigE [Bacillota bacterium]
MTRVPQQKKGWFSFKASIKQWLQRSWLRLRAWLHGAERIWYMRGNEALPAPLSAQEEAALVARLQEGDENAREPLIEHNLRLVVYIARKFDNTGVPLEDLISIGTIGLIKAVNTFDPQKHIKLATYASRCIENEILMYLRHNSRIKNEVSLDEPLNMDWDGNELLLSDVLGTEADLVYQNLDNAADREMLHIALQHLNDRERTIMELRFGLHDGREKTQKDVAEMLGISQSYISRLEKRILNQLRSEFYHMMN